MSGPRYPVGDTTGKPVVEEQQAQVLRVGLVPHARHTPQRVGVAAHADLDSGGGYVLEATFTSATVHEFAVKCAAVPQYVEPMDVPEFRDEADYVPSGVQVYAVNRSAWTRNRIYLQVRNDGFDKDPFPFRQRFRVYAGSGKTPTVLSSAIAGASETLREQIVDVVDNVSVEPGAGKIPRAGESGELDPAWIPTIPPSLTPWQVMTAVEILALEATEGMAVWNSTDHCLVVYDGVRWVSIAMAMP